MVYHSLACNGLSRSGPGPAGSGPGPMGPRVWFLPYADNHYTMRSCCYCSKTILALNFQNQIMYGVAVKKKSELRAV